jgi:hypothetical protein
MILIGLTTLGAAGVCMWGITRKSKPAALFGVTAAAGCDVVLWAILGRLTPNALASYRPDVAWFLGLATFLPPVAMLGVRFLLAAGSFSRRSRVFVAGVAVSLWVLFASALALGAGCFLDAGCDP